MHSSKPKTTCNKNKLILSYSCTSKEEFVREYERLHCEEVKAKEFYLLVLTELEKVITQGDIDSFKRLSGLIECITELEDPVTLKDCYDSASNPIGSTNLVILASKHNKLSILQDLLEGDSKVLNNLSIGIGRAGISPEDADEATHNAFYYAIRTRNVQFLDILISKWPDNYFAVYSGQLDKILSKAYEELKLKNVPLSEEMEGFVEKKLMDLRFFSNDTTRQDRSSDLDKIKERIDLVLQNVNLLRRDYSNTTEEVDGRFILVAKFIAQNIHVLKRQLKCTYDRLPWEEMEFCLIIFVSFHIKPQELNLIYRATLNKNKILIYLENFANALGNIEDITRGDKLYCLPKGLIRENVVGKIISTHPRFEGLYTDFQHVRDIYSLKKINDYINLALSVDPREKEGQFVITRALQVIGEHLKNTWESCKLSRTTSELLVLSLPQNTRKIILGLRDAISHGEALSKRIQIEENADDFFVNVQNDTKKVGDVITDILYKNKIKTIEIFLEKIVNSENLDEIKEVLEVFGPVELDEVITANFTMKEHERLKELVRTLSDGIVDKTNYEKECFNKINSIIHSVGTRSENIRFDYVTGFKHLQNLSSALGDNTINRQRIREIKFNANGALQNITPKVEPYNLEKIFKLSMEISRSVRSRIQQDKLENLNRLIWEIDFIVKFTTVGIKWIEELSEKLNEKVYVPRGEQRKICSVTPEQLAVKLTELKIILGKNFLDPPLSLSNTDKKLNAVLEMLLLDVLSILGSSKDYLEDNLLFLDDHAPFLHGTCLRHHLAHDNAIVDILLSSDPSRTIILNAKKLTEEDIMKTKRKIGKPVSDDPIELKEKFDRSLITVTNQERLFAALEDGSLETVKDCLRKGADLKARSINFRSTLHHAAKGPSLEVVKFIFDQNLNTKDDKGQTPLHIAAAHGRQDTVDFFVTEAGLHVDDLTNSDKTPLHLAAQHGHEDTVEVLLKNKANTAIQDKAGNLPVYYAIQNNHVGVAKTLLQKDFNEIACDSSLLHLAAEHGHLELVNFLIESNCDVNARTDQNKTPLHAAATSGHLEVVTALIRKEANVNAKDIFDYRPLHRTVQNGYCEIAKILLQHGACVNAVDKANYNTPLHYAAHDGHDEIVKILLDNNANPNVATVDGITPLHSAVQNNHATIVAALLTHGVDIHTAKSNNHVTPLHCAANCGHTAVAALLLENKVDVNAKSKDNLTALHAAALKGHIDVMDLLIKNNAEVNARDNEGSTPLHFAAMHGSTDSLDLLIRNNAEIDARTGNGITPLHAAAMTGNGTAVDFLIRSNAEVNAADKHGSTSLQFAVVQGHKDIVNLLINNSAQADCSSLKVAVEAGHKEIVDILVTNGADVNDNSNNLTPLFYATRFNHKEIVEFLIAKGADVNAEGSEGSHCLTLAIFAGNADIVQTLIKSGADVNKKNYEYGTSLHLAACMGHKKIVNALIAKGVDVDAISDHNNATPLLVAAHEGYEQIVKILIARGASVNCKSNEDVTPLHIAGTKGHSNVVKVLLDNSNVDLNVKNIKNETPLLSAVIGGHLQVVKMLLQYQNDDCNDLMLLPLATKGNHLKLVKYFVLDERFDIDAKISSGNKSIHIAAAEGYKDSVEFFLSRGLSINERGAFNMTILHCAAMNGHVEIVNYLIEQGADITARDANGLTPMHLAVNFGKKNVIEVLLQNGAVYNASDKFFMKTSHNKDIIALLDSTENLFKAVKRNNCSEVLKCLRKGAFVNCRSAENVTPLHYAAWKGYDEVVDVLLQNGSNPNAVGNKRLTSLHYAAKFSHLKIVKCLLSHHAVHNAISDDGKTPLDLTVDDGITSLLKLVDVAFQNIQNGDSRFVDNLSKIKEVGIVKAIMCAYNTDHQTLVIVAMNTNFSDIQQLKEISQEDVSGQINEAVGLLNLDQYQKALSIFRSVLDKRKELLGPDNPVTLDVQTHIAKVLYAQGAYQEALKTNEEIFQKQKEILSLNSPDTLNTRSTIALILHKLGRNKDAVHICREVHRKQTEILGPNHADTLTTQNRLALALHGIGKFKEALISLKNAKYILGANHPTAMQAQEGIAMVLASQGNYKESLEIYEELLKKQHLIFGNNHSNVLKTLDGIAGIHFDQKKYHESLKVYQKVLYNRKNILGSNHPDTLSTQCNVGTVLFVQRKWFGALKAYREGFDQMKSVFGPTDPIVLFILDKVESLKVMFNLKGREPSEILQHLQKDINIAARNGDAVTVQRLLENGDDANDKDVDGITPLHYAVSFGHRDVINILLKYGADVTQVTDKGNTPLHIAASKGYREIADVLLHRVSYAKLDNFINAKTTAGGATSLHVAALNGHLDVTKSLLSQGAMYDIANNQGKTPLDLSTDPNIINLLKLVEDLFDDAKNGNIEMIDKLGSIKPDELVVVTHARNSRKYTLVEIVKANQHDNVASELLKLLKDVHEQSEV